MKSPSLAKRIFIVHPTLLTTAPLQEAFKRIWPEAALFNLIDESLYDVLDPNGTITVETKRRVKLALDYCVEARADAIVFNGATFGPAVVAARASLKIPVLMPIEALAAQAVLSGGRVAVLCTSKRSMPAILQAIDNAAQGKAIAVMEHFVDGAHIALMAGDAATHDRLVAAAADAITDCDVLVFAQTPMVSALPRLKPCAGRRVLTTPEQTAIRLKTLLS